MSQEDVAEFSRAVSLAQASNKAAAHAIFINLINKYPDNILVLLWFAFTAPTIGEARGAISRAAQLAPNNPDVQQAQSWLEAETANNGDFNTRLNRAVTLAQAGNKTQAYQDLKALARETGAKDANLLLWLAFTSPDLEEADTAIKMAESQSPGNPNIGAAQLWLRQEKLKLKGNSFATASEFKAATNSFDFHSPTNQDSYRYSSPTQAFNAASNPQFQPGLNSVPNRIEPQPNSVPASLISRRRRVDTFTILAGALGVVVILLIAWGVYFFTSTPSTTQSETVFEKAGLSTYSELEKLEVPQSLKDQLSTNYSNGEFAKNGVKFAQVDVYKINTASSPDNFNKFYKSELNKGGWNLQTVPIQSGTTNPLTMMIALKGNFYIFLGAAASNNPLPELKSQLAPNQAVAIALLFEKTQQ